MTLEKNRQLEVLVAKARSGDKAAFSEIVRMMMRPAIALTYRMVHDREAAIDLAQDTFVTAWEKLRSFRGIRNSRVGCSRLPPTSPLIT